MIIRYLKKIINNCMYGYIGVHDVKDINFILNLYV